MKRERKQSGKRKWSGWVSMAVGKGVVIGGLIAWLFYKSLVGLVCAPVCIVALYVQEKRRSREKEQEREQEFFVEYLGFLKEALAVGYSLEQAVGEAKKGMLTSLKESNAHVMAVARMERKMQLGMSVEAAFSEWADEALCEDIRDFSEVLFIAKRTGGAVQQVIENTERVIRDKQETLRYIRSVLHSREYEAKVMKAMPFAILLYLQLFMSDFLAPLYHNPVGICVMTVVLVVYLALCLVVDKITAITL